LIIVVAKYLTTILGKEKIDVILDEENIFNTIEASNQTTLSRIYVIIFSTMGIHANA